MSVPQTIDCFHVTQERARDHLAAEIGKRAEGRRIVAVATLPAENTRGAFGVMVTLVTEA